jgi:hypothetical protein
MSRRQSALPLSESQTESQTLLVGCRLFGQVYQAHLGFLAETMISTGLKEEPDEI